MLKKFYFFFFLTNWRNFTFE